MFTIDTDRWHEGREIHPWRPEGQLWQTDDEAEAIRTLVYWRYAYPGYTFILLSDGYIVSTAELAQMAKHLLF